jgi:hypothetical protein
MKKNSRATKGTEVTKSKTHVSDYVTYVLYVPNWR